MKAGEADRSREILDIETCGFFIIQRDNVGVQHFDLRVREAFFERRWSHALRDSLYRDLDKDAASACSIVLVRLGCLQSTPRDCIIRKKVAKEPRDVTQTIRFVTCLKALS
jgi:hypothetical protein